MKLDRYIAFSVVACSILSGANYTDWNVTQPLNSDSITIDYSTTSTPSPTPLSGSLTINGNSTATISGDLTQGTTCGYVACWNNNASLSGSGNLTFTINASTTNSLPAFVIKGGLTVDAGITVSGTLPSTIFEAKNGASLTFSGDTTINGNGNTAITMGSGALSINANGNKQVNISGNITTNGGTSTIKLDNRDTINGTYSGSGTLNLTIDNSTYAGNVTNSGTSTINITNSGQLQGTLTTSGTSLNLTMNNGSITQSVNSTATTNNVTMTGGTISGKLSTTGNGTTNTITIKGGASVGGGFDASGTTTLTMDSGTINGTSTISGGTSFTADLKDKSNLGTLASSASTNDFKSDSSTITSLTLNGATKNEATLTNSTVTNGVSLQGRNNTVTMSGGSIGGKLSTQGGGTNTVTIQDSASISGGFDAQGNTTLTMTNGTINGTSNITGNSFTANLTTSTIGTMTSTAITNDFDTKSSTITELAFNGTTNTLKVRAGGNTTIGTLTMKASGTNEILTEFDPPMLEVGTLVMEGKNNHAWRLNQNTAGVNLHVTGNATVTATNGGSNTFIFRKGGVDGTLTTSGNSTINIFNDTKVGSMHHKSGTFNSEVAEQSKVSNGITTEATSGAVNIEVSGTAQLNGVSTLGSTTSVLVTMQDTATGGTINLQAPTNTLKSINGTNGVNGTKGASTNALEAVSMTGTNNTINVTTGNSLTITGNTTLTANNGGSNTVDFDNGGINGTLTTSGTTTLKTRNATSIGQGIVHSNGNFTATFNNSSTINGGITTSGTGDSKATFNDTSTLKGNSSFASTNNTLILNGTSSVTGNTSFSNTSTLTANNGTNITGQIITAGGSATYTFGSNGGNGGSTVSGGIDTNQGAGKTTANFNNSSKLQNGTSTFHSDIDITFANNSQAIGETFNVAQGTANITFKDNAEMQGGSITNNGGTANITFTGDSKMTNSPTGGTASINTHSGTTKLTANTNANLTGTMTQSGGTFTADFKNNSQFNGNATQSGGTSDITFQDQAKWTGNFNQSNGASNITFHGTANMQGNITTTNGTTNISFDNRAFIKGDVKAQGTDNKVKFDNSLLDGDLTLDGYGTIMGHSKGEFTRSRITGDVTGYDEVQFNLTTSEVQGQIFQGPSANNSGMTGTFTDSKVEGGFKGQNSINNLTLNNSEIDNGVKQSQGKLTLTATESIITGGFEGTNNSENKITMTKGSLSGGIKQTTGSLDLESDRTSISGGFEGNNSTNTMLLMDVNFNNGNITQTQGVLKGDIIGTSNLGNFSGTNSTNILQLTHSIIKNIDQSGGGLTFTTDSNVDGYIKGVNNSTNSISLRGSSVTGEISQNTGEMVLQTFNTTTQAISMTNATFSLQANNTQATNMTLTDSNSSGTANSLHLTGTFSQTNGVSSLVFASSIFDQDSTLSNASATLNFTGSTIQDLSATNGTSSIVLANSSMQDFSGTRGTHSLILSSSSSANEISQSVGSLSVSASSQSNITGDITAKGFATLTVSLSDSVAQKNIINTTGGGMTISAVSSTIQGNIEQKSAGNLSLSATNSTIQGKYYQNEGAANVNFLDSKINNGIELKHLQNGTMNFDQGSIISNGLQFLNNDPNKTLIFDLLGGSSIEGTNPTQAIKQEAGNMTGSLNRASSIKGEISLKNGVSKLSLYGGSKIIGDIIANQNQTNILVDNSFINGNMTITGGTFSLVAQNQTTIQGNTAGSKSQITIANADFALTVDSQSTFNGDITQTNNKQDILIQQNSTLNGDITNTSTTSSIKVENATLQGKISQTNGSLALNLSNKGIITGEIELNETTTTLSGIGTQNQIRGNFTQTGGNLNGTMHGLTLGGEFKQTNGTSNVTFTNSTFTQNTTITDATNSSLTFDQSTLTNYTTSGGNNTLKLINNSRMNGTLNLQNQAQTTLTMNDSTLNGATNTAINSQNSVLTLDTSNSQITGAIDIDTGGLQGTTNNTNITGNITLTNTNSNVSFENTSTINGQLTATDGSNIIEFDNSTITQSITQTNGSINLDLSNGSKIGTNLIFESTQATLTGKGGGNIISGYLLSNQSTLQGDIAGLNLKGTFTQNNGQSNITFRDTSLFEGIVTINGGDSNIKFSNNSGIQNEVILKNTTQANLGFLSQSFITGNITATDSQNAAISVQDSSTIKGQLSSNNSILQVSLENQSSFEGQTTQNQGTLNLSASGNSTITSDLSLNNGVLASVVLSNSSSLLGTITSNSTPLNFTLNNNSAFNTQENPQAITVENADITLNAWENAKFWGDLNQTSINGNSSAFTFSSGSGYEGSMTFSNIDLQAQFNQATLISPQITLTAGKPSFSFNNSSATIDTLNATNTNLSISLSEKSNVAINTLNITGDTLLLNASNSSRLSSSNITLEGKTEATYTATTNGNLNVDTTIANTASTLSANISGGILQGSIVQVRGATGFDVGEITLESIGDDGGRWLVTNDSQIKSLTIKNTQEAISSSAVLASPFNTPLSIVDFTTEKKDTQIQSRIGKMIIAKPEPIGNQPIPEAGEGQTYARQLQLNEIKGNNGLFRIYADLGTKLADNILADKASGNHLIQIYYRADTFREIDGDRIVVAKVRDTNTSVSFTGTQSEIGLTRYNTEIIKENAKDGNGFEWIIGQATPAGISYSSKIIASILQGQYQSFLIEIDSLDRRMGDLEFINRDKGLWMRSYIGSNTKEATDFSTLSNDNYYSIWGGFDFNSIGLTVHNYVGLFFNYTGITSENKDYLGKISNIAFGVYNTFKAFSGFYADILAKYICTLNQYEISNYSLTKNKPKFDNHKFLLNAEIGYSFYYGEKKKSGYIQPQFQVTSGYIHKVNLSFLDASGETINASLGRSFPVSLRLGTFWGQVFGEKIKSHIKVGTSIVYDTNNGGDLTLKDNADQVTFKQEWDLKWLLSAHADFTFNDFFKLYTSFDTSFFGNYNTTYSFNIGLRFSFGRPNNVVANVPSVYSTYTPPIVINDDKRTVPVVKRYTTHDIDQNYVGKPRKVESYIQGNSNMNIQQTPQYSTPSRQPHRDITEIVDFGAKQ